MRVETRWLSLVATFAIAVACGSDDPDVVRKGGEIPEPNNTAGSGVGAVPNGDAGSGGVPEISWCEALSVLKGKCQRCHGDPQENGAPMALLTYEDTQAKWSATQNVNDVMLDVVSRDIMPYVALNDSEPKPDRPVEPLTSTEKATLVGWLMQGAKPVGGTDCP